MDKEQLMLALGALQLAQTALPVIQGAIKGGAVTAEQQAELLAKYKELRDNLDAAFSGPGWQIEPDPS